MNNLSFQEYDAVVLREQLSERLKSGILGVIVFIHDSSRGIYEVEFFDDKKETIDVVTVTASQIQHAVE